MLKPLGQTERFTRLGELERFALPGERRLHRFRLGRNMTDTWGGAQLLARMLLAVESQTSRTRSTPRTTKTHPHKWTAPF